MAAGGTQFPPSSQPYNAGNGLNGTAHDTSTGYDDGMHNHHQHAYSQPTMTKAKKRSGRFTNLLLSILLAIAIALAAAPVAGYKSGWAYYRRRNYLAPAQLRIPAPITLRIWVGWVKGTNSITNLLHAAAPQRYREFTYLRDVRESGQVVAGIAIAFLLLSGIVGLFYLLACLFHAIRGARKATADAPPRSSIVPAGLPIVAFIFGFLNMAWACACYIIVSVGTAIYTRRTLQATYVCWPDWCFWLAFFSGVFWIIAGLVALSGRGRRQRTGPAAPAHMTHNAVYDNNVKHPQATYHEEKPRPVV